MRKNSFFSKSGGEVVCDKAENRYITILDFFNQVPEKFMC